MIKTKNLFQPAFIACVVILAVSAASKEVVIRTLGVQLTKLPIPLKVPFDKMDEKKLEPYLVRNKQKITNRDVLESLGTEEYLQWSLEDSNAPADSPTRFCSLFITYYTGNPDMVPHVPDECYVGGGNQRSSADEIIVDSFSYPKQTDNASSLPKSIPMQYVVFSRQEKNSLTPETRFSVQYMFKANGEFCGSRTQTRTVLGKNFFCKYSYFAKIEWKFYGMDYSGVVNPDKEQTVKASRKLLSILVPVLEADHWPDWEKAKRGEVPNFKQ
jgi:hypothetical protein